MKNIKSEIRRIVNGRAEIKPILKHKSGKYWVEMYVTSTGRWKQYNNIRDQIVADLRAGGIPADSGHYGTEISFGDYPVTASNGHFVKVLHGLIIRTKG